MGFFVYTLAHPQSKEIRYVGQTERPLPARLAEHKYNSTHKHTHLYCWWRSCSPHPEIELLEEYSSAEEMDKGEIYWIKRLRTIGARLTNHSDGGEAGFRGGHHTAEAKAKISAKSMGRPNTNYHLSIQRAHEALRNHVRTPEENKSRGRPQTPEMRLAHSRALGVRPFVDETGRVFQTITEASNFWQCDGSTIGRILSGKSKKQKGRDVFATSIKGHTFKYLEADNLPHQENTP